MCIVPSVCTRRDPKNFYLLTGCGLPSSTTKKIFLAFEGHKGRKAKKGQKNKYGLKCLELSNSARNAKKAKNCQKEPKAWRATNLAFKGLKLEI